jgi:hypothetical protein
MAMVGQKTQAIYSRYAIADEAMLREAALKLAGAAPDRGPSAETRTQDRPLFKAKG